MIDNRDQPLTTEESEVLQEIRRLYSPTMRGEVRVIGANAHIDTYQVTTSKKPSGTGTMPLKF